MAGVYGAYSCRKEKRLVELKVFQSTNIDLSAVQKKLIVGKNWAILPTKDSHCDDLELQQWGQLPF